MKYALYISEAAELDIRDAFLWYTNHSDQLGHAFEEQIKLTLRHIQKNPLKVQIRYYQIRVAFLKKFPFGIHFNVTENIILVVAVFHTSANPRKWVKS